MWKIWKKMKNNAWHGRLSLTFFLLTVLLALVSWVGSVYGAGGVQSLLSAEGIRWMLGHVVENYVQAPALGVVLVLFMGLGIGIRAGLYDVLKRFCRKEKLLSRKERRALLMSAIAFGMFVALIVIALLLPWNFLYGVTGSWMHSPIAKGWCYLLSIGIGLSGMVYGYVSDVFRNWADVVHGMSWLISRLASYFVTLFFIVQFFSSLVYTGLAEWMGLPDGWMEVLFQLFCYFPLLLF
jgi:aminobenzoyl-glutamate transport protein